MIEYIIATGSSYASCDNAMRKLKSNVNRFLSNSWSLQGGVSMSVNERLFVAGQAMIREKEDEDEWSLND